MYQLLLLVRAPHVQPAVFSDANGIGHPFDLVKTRLQTAPAGTYVGAIDVVKKAVAKDGAIGCVLFWLQIDET